MNKWKGLGASVAALVVGLAIAVPAHGAQDVTVAQFIERLASNRNVEARDAASVLEALGAAGMRTPSEPDLHRPLTEGDVVAFASAMNLRLSTTRPEQPFSSDQLERFFAVFGDELGTSWDGSESGHGEDGDGEPPDEWPGDGEGPAFDPFTKGKGKGKGTVTPTEP